MKKYSYLVFLFFFSCINVSEEQKVLVKNIGETQGTFYNIRYSPPEIFITAPANSEFFLLHN